MPTELDPEKAVEVLLYVAPRMKNSLYNSLKIIYLADKLHLSATGSFIYGECYSALEHGPVPSFAYDVLKVGSGRSCYNEKMIKDTPNFDGAFDSGAGTAYKIATLRDADADYLAETDIEALDAAIEKYGDGDFGELKALTHDDAYHATTPRRAMSIQAIAATTSAGAELVQHLESEHVDNIEG